MQAVPELKQLEGILQQNFGLSSFRPQQVEAITATLQGRDSIVILPTGTPSCPGDLGVAACGTPPSI